jgi:hypothetical protein
VAQTSQIGGEAVIRWRVNIAETFAMSCVGCDRNKSIGGSDSTLEFARFAWQRGMAVLVFEVQAGLG